MADFRNISGKIIKNLDYCIRKALQRSRSLIFPLSSPSLPRPVFVVGCSRSGTTLVYRTLSNSRDLASLHRESHDFWNHIHPLEAEGFDGHSLGRDRADRKVGLAVRRHFYSLLGNRRFVDKANQNCFRVEYLQEIFPDAFFVHVVRNGPDNINSLIHGWNRPDEYGTWSAALPAEVRIEQGHYRRWCFFLFNGWRRYLDSAIEEVCARQWLEANQAVLNSLKTVPSARQVRVCYEDILANPEAAFKEVFDRLELPFDDKMKGWCSTVISNPTNAFSRPRLDKWKEENPDKINRIMPVIDGMMRELGYKV